MQHSKRHGPLAVLLSIAVVATPTYLVAQDSGSLSRNIEEREKREQERPKKKKGGLFGKIATAASGVGTAALCGAFKKGASNTKKAGCAALGVAVGFGVSQLGKSIRKRTNEKEQAELLDAAGDTLADGQPRSLMFPETGTTGSVTPTGKVVYQDAKIFMFYDSVALKSREKIEVIAQPYLTNRSANLRGSPNTSGKPIRTLAADTPLHVVGRVPGQDWYMVSQKVSEGEYEALMVSGYISSQLLTPAGVDYELPVLPAPESVSEIEFDVALRCDELTFAVQDVKGKRGNDTSKNCLGPEGKIYSA